MRLLITFATVTSGGPDAGGGALLQPSSANRPNIERSMVRFSGAFIALGLPVPSGARARSPQDHCTTVICAGNNSSRTVLQQRACFCLFHQPAQWPVDR